MTLNREWELIAEALEAGTLVTIRALAEAQGFPPDAWPFLPRLGQLAKDLAIRQLGTRIQREKGLRSFWSAAMEAEVRLGLKPDSYRGQWLRWKRRIPPDKMSLAPSIEDP